MGNNLISHIDGVILAGGTSQRFVNYSDSKVAPGRQNKANLVLGDRKFIDHAVSAFSEVFTRVIVLANTPLVLENTSVTVMPDRVEFQPRSSLGGIMNALSVSQQKNVCIGACDMPFVQKELLTILSEINTNADLVIPLFNKVLHPLPAVYNASCLEIIMKQIRQGNHRILDFFQNVSMHIIPEHDLVSAGVGSKSFININTWEDYQKALREM